MRPSSAEARYRRDGYAVVDPLFAPADIEALTTEAARVIAADGGDPDVLALHFPHKISPVFLESMRAPGIVDMLTRLIGPDVKAIQSMLFIKGPGQPGQAWHQDEQFIPTRDRSLCGVWIALDEATVENGCLWAHPGSQEPGVLFPMRAHGETRFDASEEAFGFPYPREGGVPLTVRAGGAVFFNGYLLHRSLANTTTAAFRRALVFHYMSARSLLPWDHDGRSPTTDLRDIILIAGSDPYEWKGLADVHRPYVRKRAAG